MLHAKVKIIMIIIVIMLLLPSSKNRNAMCFDWLLILSFPIAKTRFWFKLYFDYFKYMIQPNDMSHDARNRSSGFPTRFDINQPVQSQKKARILKFWV